MTHLLHPITVAKERIASVLSVRFTVITGIPLQSRMWSPTCAATTRRPTPGPVPIWAWSLIASHPRAGEVHAFNVTTMRTEQLPNRFTP
ncbi:MAG: hypothetical protein K8H89_01770 [Flavobacteriales bacterium]|jgi:hypothetical protein|nr:hypothetical protein [Flavobacteriales bacterium]